MNDQNNPRGLTPCDLLELINYGVWRKIKFARKTDLSIAEVYITQDLLFAFHELIGAFKVPVKLYESKMERQNGNDLEIVVEIKTGEFACFSVQAKIIDKRNRYPTLRHWLKRKRKEQIELLLQHSARQGSIPMYMFYNYYDNSSAVDYLRQTNGCAHEMGCTLINANDIKREFTETNTRTGRIKWNIPDFETLHEQPFICLPCFGCCLVERTRTEIEAQFRAVNSLRFFTKEEILKSPYWKDLLKPIRLAGIMEFTTDESIIDRPLTSESYEDFHPKFRLVFFKEYIDDRSGENLV